MAVTSLASCLYTLNHLKNAAVLAHAQGRSFDISGLAKTLGLIDIVLAFASIVSLGFLVYLERCYRSVCKLLLTPTPGQSLTLLTIVVAWLGQAYLYPGVLLGGDSGSHTARFLEVREGFAAGIIPQWTNFDYLGSPLLGFTGPLLYVTGGALDLLIKDPVATAKVLLFATHLGAGWAFYILLMRLNVSRAAALLASIGFAGSFAALHLFLYRGVFPQAFTIILVILVFYAAEGMMREVGALWRNWLILAVGTGMLIINHQPHALFAGFYLAIWGILSVLLGRWRLSRLWLPISAGFVGVGTAAIAVVPILAEADWVMIDPEGALFRFHLPTLARLLQLVEWRDTRTTYGIDYWAYLGIVLVGLAIFGGLAALRGSLGQEHQRLAAISASTLAISLFVYNPVVRDVIFILFFVGMLGAFGLQRLTQAAHLGSRWPMAVALALILDVVSTSVQPVARSDKEFLVTAGRYLAKTAPEERIAEIGVAQDGSVTADIGPGSGPLSAYATVQRVAGHHNMAATRVHNYAVTVIEMAAGELRKEGRVGPRTLSLLRLLNVTRIICSTPSTMGCPENFVQATEETPLGRVIHIDNAGPAVFAQQLIAMAPPDNLDKPMLWAEDFADKQNSQVQRTESFLDEYLSNAGFSWESRKAEALPVRNVPVGVPERSSNKPDWRPSVTDYRVSLQRVRLTITANGPGYAQLTHPWYPATAVDLNGKRITPLQGALDLLVIPLAAGINSIIIEPVTTPVRRDAAMVSAAMLVIAGLVATAIGVFEWHQRRKRSAEPARPIEVQKI